MADADVTINDSSVVVRKVDTRTVGAGTDEHRQVVVVGDPVTDSGVAGVSAAYGLAVDVKRSANVMLAYGAALTDRSGTIWTGGAAQEPAASNANRRYLLIQNKTTAIESLWVSLTATAVTNSPSIEIAPGATLIFEGTFVPTGAVSIVAATAGTVWTVMEG